MNSISISRQNFNITISVLAVIFMGIMSLWFPTALLKISMPDDILWSSWTTAVLQTITLVIVPYWWANRRLGMSFSELGLTTVNLGRSIIFGCALYAIALYSFIGCATNSILTNHAINLMGTGDAYLMMTSMAVIAAGTDLTTRGFILLVLTRYSHVAFAIFMQNLVWFVGHISEITYLANCMGVPKAVGLTLTLGILGDVIVLKTRNVVGLVIAHILLNVIMTLYMRGVIQHLL